MANAGPIGSYNYAYMAAAATLVVRTGPGILHAITINDPTTNSVVTVYDNGAASGQKIATIDASQALGSLVYDINFLTGLTIVMSAANSDITIAWSPL